MKYSTWDYGALVKGWLLLVISHATIAQSPATIRASEAKHHVGETVIVTATVASTKFAKESKGKPTFLNLDLPYPDQPCAIVIYGEDRRNFPEPPEKLYADRTVQVVGKIELRRGSPQIVVRSPDQISRGNAPPALPEVPQKTQDSIEVLINSPFEPARPSKETSSPIGNALLQVISGARKTLDFAIYGIRNQPQVLDALLAAKQRGVVVRGVVDADIYGKNYYSGTPEVIQRLGGIETDYQVDRKTLARQDDFDLVPFWPRPVGFKGPAQCIGYSLPGNKAIIAVHASLDEFPFRGDIMHHKFVIADRRIVWTGSCNLSDSGTGGYNANVAVVIDSPVVAGWFIREFHQMHDQGLFHRTKKDLGRGSNLATSLTHESNLDLFFSPQGNAMEDGVRPAIQAAKRSIDVAVFYLTHKLLSADLIKAHQRGVRVRVITDATSATNGYTKHEILRAAGIPVKVENWGGKMHMKAASIDGATLILGSMNWTSAGESTNDENTLILHSPEQARRFSDFFNAMWADVQDKWLTANPMPESNDSRNSLVDGIDNDFDDLVDGADLPTPLPVPLPPYWIVPKADGYGLIKGDIENGKKLFYLPMHPRYSSVEIDTGSGEQWFPSVWEAQEAGWRQVRK